MSVNCLKPSEVFTSTTVVGNALRLFAFVEKGQVLGSNKNKLFKTYNDNEDDDDDEEKEDKFAGAFVMNPAHCTSTGFMLLGVLNDYIHNFVIDFDIGSEYPTGMNIMNCCNETLLGKVILLEPEKIKIPVYENMYFVDADDEKNYSKTADVSNLMVEALSENNPTEFGRQYFNLPTFTDIAEHISDNIDDFV